MLVINKVTKTYGPEIVLNAVSLTLDKGSITGLIGANGTGKTTLFKLIIGIEYPDSGRIVIGNHERIGYLPQTISLNDDAKVQDLLYNAFSETRKIESRMRVLEEMMHSSGNDMLEEYGELRTRYEDLGGYDTEWKQKIILDGMGLGTINEFRVVATLSGGEKTRLSMAVLLMQNPDILLLDEPTNNLDTESLEWLEAYLGKYYGGVMIASHDRRFLNATVNRIVEIDEHTHELREYAGNYEDYKRTREVGRKQQESVWEAQQAEIKELNRVVHSVREVTGKKTRKRDNDKSAYVFKLEKKEQSHSRNIRSARERLSRILENPVHRPGKRMRFKSRSLSGQIRSDYVLRMEDIGKRYSGRIILNGINLVLRHDSRVVITGANGTGKTTLIRIMTGEEQPDSGSVYITDAATIGYLPQEPEIAEGDYTVLEWYRKGRSGYEKDFTFDLVTTGLFRYDDIRKPRSKLSLGQLRKLELARIIGDTPNVLILDEPTNHFSLDVIEELESALAEFNGPVLVISHDREFIRRFSGEVWELKEGKLVKRD